MLRNPEIWIILIVVGFLLFGAKRMPDAARGLGRSLRIFKAEIKGLDDEHAGQQPQAAPQAQLPAGYPQQQQPYPPVAPTAQQPYQQPVPPAQQAAYPQQPVYQQPVYQQPAPAPMAPVTPAPVEAQPERHEAQ